MIPPLYREELPIAEDQRFYRGKVRDVYRIGRHLVSIASDRISAFDHILPRPIPYKGQVLNQLAAHYLQAAADIMPVWLEKVPHPRVSIGKSCEPIRIEMVIRGYLSGHAWRTYASGQRSLCGVELPDGLSESDKLPTPIITPAVKAESGHDMDISAEDILAQGLSSPTEWDILCSRTHQLFELGSQMAEDSGLILVDTKYEFGLFDGEIVLIDEVHTPDSSRYFIKEGYADRQSHGVKQEQLSKEFVREWLMSQGFQGLEGQTMPAMPDDLVEAISSRYIQLYEQLTRQSFEPATADDDHTLLSSIQEALSPAGSTRM